MDYVSRVFDNFRDGVWPIAPNMIPNVINRFAFNGRLTCPGDRTSAPTTSFFSPRMRDFVTRPMAANQRNANAQIALDGSARALAIPPTSLIDTKYIEYIKSRDHHEGGHGTY